jgi:solute carrier family 35, member F5
VPTSEELPGYEADSQFQESSVPGQLASQAGVNQTTSLVPEDSPPSSLQLLTTREMAIEALNFFILWFLANYLGNASLKYTNVASFTILSSMSGFFTLLFGAWVRVEKFTWIKLAALCISYAPVDLEY